MCAVLWSVVLYAVLNTIQPSQCLQIKSMQWLTHKSGGCPGVSKMSWYSVSSYSRANWSDLEPAGVLYMVCSMLDIAISPEKWYKAPYGVCAAKPQVACSTAPCSDISVLESRTPTHVISPYSPFYVALQRKRLVGNSISTLGRSGAGGLGRPAWPYNWTNSPHCTHWTC